MFVVGIMTVPVGVIGIVREALTAKYFGSGAAVDAFSIAQTLALFLITVAGSSLGSVSVPEVARVSVALDRQKTNRFVYALLAIGALKFFAIAVLVVVVSPLYVAAVGAHFDESTKQLSTGLVCIFATFFFFSALSAQLSALLNFADSYAFPALSHLLVPVSASVALLMFQSSSGIELLAWGVAIGGGVQCLTLMLILVKTYGFPDVRSAEIRISASRIVRAYSAVALGALVMGLTPFVDLHMAAQLGTGSVASLSYGILIPTLCAGFLARALAGPALSVFSQQIAAGNFSIAARSLNRYVFVCLALTALPTVLLIILTPSIVDILFVHSGGTAVDEKTISQVQAWLSLQIPFYAAGIIAVRMLTALRLNYLLLAMGVAHLVLKLVLNHALLQPLGVAGIAASTSAWYAIALFWAWYLATSALSRARDDSL